MIPSPSWPSSALKAMMEVVSPDLRLLGYAQSGTLHGLTGLRSSLAPMPVEEFEGDPAAVRCKPPLLRQGCYRRFDKSLQAIMAEGSPVRPIAAKRDAADALWQRSNRLDQHPGPEQLAAPTAIQDNPQRASALLFGRNSSSVPFLSKQAFLVRSSREAGNPMNLAAHCR